jgi:hypothetical protein
MRIFGPNGPAAPTTAPAARRAANSPFTLPQEQTQAMPAGSSGVRTLGGIDALIALQGVEGVQGVEAAEERRRRAVKRGRTALDALDELKLGLLSGRLDQAILGRLKAATAGLKDDSGDPALDGVLAEIELRVEVELAKIDSAAAA